MNRLIQFFKKIYLFIIFIILEVLALNTYQDSSVYMRGQLHNVSNRLMIKVHETIGNVKEYFQLRDVNNDLVRRNSELMFRLSAMESVNLRLVRGEIIDTLVADTTVDTMLLDTLHFQSDTTVILVDAIFKKDRYISAKVINNSVDRQHNFITLNRGEVDSVRVNYPVVANDCVVGYIVAVSRNYSVAISMLNKEFKSSGMLSRNGSLCSVFWSGLSPDEVEFSGVSRYSDIQVGDTVVTTGFSSYFTAGKLIGTVTEFDVKDQMYYSGKLKTSTPFNKLRYVEIIYPDNFDERFKLENQIINNQ